MRGVARILKRRAVDLYWSLHGPRLQFPELPSPVHSILFVCKGNICRSPFAELVARRLADEGRIDGVTFASAGLHVSRPKAPPVEAVRVAAARGVALETHRSRGVSRELLSAFDLVVVMEVWQSSELARRFPEHSGKVFVLPIVAADGRRALSGYAGFNIEDPYGRSAEDFHRCFGRIEDLLGSWVPSLSGERSTPATSGVV